MSAIIGPAISYKAIIRFECIHIAIASTAFVLGFFEITGVNRDEPALVQFYPIG